MIANVKKILLVVMVLMMVICLNGPVMAANTGDGTEPGLVDQITDKAAEKIVDKAKDEIKKQAPAVLAEAKKQGENLVTGQFQGKSLTDIMKNPIFLIIAALFVISLVAKLIRMAITLAVLAGVFMAVAHYFKF